jgi:hypothetical protein
MITGYIDTGGSWQINIDGEHPAPGDVFTLTVPPETRTLTVPVLSAHLNPRTAAVTGEAPAGENVTVYLYGRYTRLVQTVPAPDGTYTANFPQFAYLPELRGYVEYRTPQGDTVQLDFAAPHWEVTIGQRSVMCYSSRPGEAVDFAWYSVGGEVLTGTRTTSVRDGSFALYLKENIAPGDRLVITDTLGTRIFTVPRVTAVHDYTSQTLTGTALPRARVDVDFRTLGGLYANGGGISVIRRVYADPQGNYGMDTSDLPLLPGALGSIKTWDTDGNRIQVDFVVNGYQTWLPLIAYQK